MSACPPLWHTSLPRIFARAFTPPPDEPLPDWASREVLIPPEDAAQPGPYRWRKTPTTRRLQELLPAPHRYCWSETQAKWVRTIVTLIAIQKSTQSGYTEAVFNFLRWIAKFRPRNVIYAVDSDKEVKKLARRLLRSLQLLTTDPDHPIFTGDPDDLRTSEFILRGMSILFYGSGAPGAFANKLAEITVIDEAEEHVVHKGDTSNVSNAKHRGKTSDTAITIALSKPKLDNGPINRLFKTGNCEEYFLACPHCQHIAHLDFAANEADAIETPFDHQHITALTDPATGVIHHLPTPLESGQTRHILPFRVKFEHLKTLLGDWDRIAMEQGGVCYQCPECKADIPEADKQRWALAGYWMPTQHGDPSTLTQHGHDLLSTDAKSSLSAIAREFLDASRAGAAELQGWLNNRLGKTRRLNLVNLTEKNLIRSIGGKEGDGFPPYPRGTVPFLLNGQKDSAGRPLTDGMLILGADIGMGYARWVIGAVRPGSDDVAVIDWSSALDPHELATLMLTATFPTFELDPHTGQPRRYKISFGYVDARYQKNEVYKACLAVRQMRRQHHLIPVQGAGGRAARGHEFSWTQMPNYPPGFHRLVTRDFEAKNDLYIDRLGKHAPRIYFPHDLLKRRNTDDPSAPFTAELCGEQLITPPGEPAYWQEPSPKPNHYGDALKYITTGLRFHRRLKAGHHIPNGPLCNGGEASS